MKPRGLRDATASLNVQLPTKPVTRAATKRNGALDLRSFNKKVVEDKENEAVPMECDAKEEDERILVAKYDHVGDIDCEGEDWRNSQLVACYVKDIFSYLQSIENVQQVRKDYLCSPSKMEISPRMHRILFDWLVQVHQRFTLIPETLYLSLHIIDYYMSRWGKSITKTSYQLLGVAAMFLASKYEEIYPPEIRDFVFLTDNSYTASQVREMERELFSKLDFHIGQPLEIQFLRRYSKVSQASSEVHEMAKYLTELSRCNYSLVHLPPSGLAAAAFCLGAELLAKNYNAHPKGWTAELSVFSGYLRYSLQPTINMIAKILLQLQTETKHLAVKKKYETRFFSCISTYPELDDPRNPLLLKYAANAP